MNERRAAIVHHAQHRRRVTRLAAILFVEMPTPEELRELELSDLAVPEIARRRYYGLGAYFEHGADCDFKSYSSDHIVTGR
jgi:hypothetical protein